jgi:anaerobic magnesium-protoporphyrin IX monomethyl ester cyclase
MHILLINPPTQDNKKFIREGRCTQEQGVWATLWPPVSLTTIGAALEQNGHEVQIMDCAASGMTWDALGEEIKKITPRLVLWSTGTPSIHNDLTFAAFVKKISPTTVTAVFGTHVTKLDRECLGEYPEVDCIIRHEPELTALELAQAIQDEKAFESIPGLTFRTASGEIMSNPSRPFIEDLDGLPHPAWHLIDTNLYRLPFSGERFLIIAPLRGCPFNCSFCTCQTYYGKKLRKRSVESVIKEIEYDMVRFDVRNFFVWAETFVVDKHYVEQLCRAIIERGLNISWTCNSRVDTVDAALLKLMKQAGCWMISFGIESAEQKILDEVQKGTTVEQAQDAVRWAHEAGIKAVGHIIFGLPGETSQSIMKTMAYAKKLGLDLAQFYCAVPFPGSALYERASNEGWIRDSDFSHYKQDNAVMELPTITSQEVNQYRARAYRRFYFSPRNMLNVAKLIGWKNAGKTARAVFDFLGWTK